MKKWIVIFDTNKKQCLELCAFLKDQNYHTTPVFAVKNLGKHIREEDNQILVLDLDTGDVNEKLFKNIKKINPSLSILGLSNRRFHPELEEAMSSHIYACLRKPVDEDELIFFLKSLG